MEYVTSACLAGLHCKYNGGSNPCQPIVALYKQGKILAVCPETLAGLPSPRVPSEQREGKVFSKNGEDLTAQFEKGAQKALQLALAHGCKKAVVKSRSPSCGYGCIYDGSFMGKLCAGNGIWTQKLLAEGFEIYTEENLPPEFMSSAE